MGNSEWGGMQGWALAFIKTFYTHHLYTYLLYHRIPVPTLESLSRVPSSERLSGSLVHVRTFAAGLGGHDLRRFVSHRWEY